VTNPDYRALCFELSEALCGYTLSQYDCLLVASARAALAQPKPAPTDEELIGPIMWMLDDCVYDNDKGEIAQSLRRLIARWGTPANNTREENFDD
jgi:hypothetical protein